MERVLSFPSEPHPIGGSLYLRQLARQPPANFSERDPQLAIGANTSNEVDTRDTNFYAAQRARTSLTIGMDMLRVPNTGSTIAHKENTVHISRSVPHSTPNDSPADVSTPGSYNKPYSGITISPSGYVDVECNGNTQPESGTDNAPPPKKLTSDDIPVLDSFPGCYGFDLYRPLCGDTYEASETKPSTAFFYFKDEQGWTNLYSKKAPTWWTLSYWCQRQPPEGSFLRLTPVYGTSDKQQEVIQRCFEDFMAIPTNSLARYSIVMVGNSLAEYFFDPITDRLCVTLPYEKPKEGCEYSQFNGKFMCFNSCLYNGGQGNKKPLFLIITLERLVSGNEPGKGQCEVLGRQCIKFRSCACPKRDKENSEKRTGEVSNYSMQNFGKRGKDSDRSEKQGKRMRSHMQDSLMSNAKSGLKSLNTRWNYLGRQHTAHKRHSSAGEITSRNTEDYLIANENTHPTIVNYNGEAYHLLLVPAGVPGAMEALGAARFGLMYAWYSNPPPVSKTRQPILSQKGVKLELDGDRTYAKGGNVADSFHDSHSLTESAMQQLLSAEAQLAHTIRERLRLSGQYHYSGDSTDSPSNSNGAVPLALGSLDDPVNQTCPVGPLSSDSGISTDMLQQQRNSGGSINHSNSVVNERFHGSPSSRRAPFYSNLSNISQSAAYELDYSGRFHAQPNGLLYASHNQPDEQHTSVVSAYPPEIMETYTLVRQSTAGASDMLSLEPHPSKPQTTSQRNTNSRSDVTTITSEAAIAISMNLNHALTSSAFYPPNYFVNRSNSSLQISQLDNFPRGHANSIQENIPGDRTNICFYPSAGSGNVSESVLLTEDVLAGYSERDKVFDGSEANNHVYISRRQHQDSPPFSSPSPCSCTSACCDK